MATIDPTCANQTHNSMIISGVTIGLKLFLPVNLTEASTYYDVYSRFTFTPAGKILPSSCSSFVAMRVG